MALTLDNLVSGGDIEAILKIDGALDVTDEEYRAYLDGGLDESKLKFKAGEEPTRFIMSRTIPFKHVTRIENSKISYDKSGEMKVQLGFMIEEVRATLKGIKNPSSVPDAKQIKLKFTGDGLVSDDQMASFQATGIVNDLYACRQAALARIINGDLKKS